MGGKSIFRSTGTFYKRAESLYWILGKTQGYCTRFLENYFGLSLYDIYIDKIYTMDDEDLHFVKKYGYDLIGNPDNPYGASTDHAYFIIHDDFFVRILETDQSSDIVLKVISKYVSFP